MTYRTYIAVPSSAWIDDYFEWSVEDNYCCRLYENGSFCRREAECEDCVVDEEDEPLEYVGGVDFEDMYHDDYEYDYTYGDLDISYDTVDEIRKKKLKHHKKRPKPTYKEDIYDYSYGYGDMSVDYNSGSPLTGTREIPGDDGWPNNSKEPVRNPHKSHETLATPPKITSTPSKCHSCPISALPNNPFRPDPEVFNQYLPMFLKDNPDKYCPKAGHAAYGQVS